MIGRWIINSAKARTARFGKSEDGATLVEFGLAIVLLLLIFFALIDFGRMAFHYVTAEKMVQVAARIAAVRPPVCAGVPTTHTRGTLPADTAAPRYGTTCDTDSWVCNNPGTISCTATSGDATSEEIWDYFSVVLPPDATMSDIVFRYDFDPALGFLGGPYVPVVTVELQNLTFQFVMPLSGLAAIAAGGATQTTNALGGTIAFPALSASVPGEDLAVGTSG